MPEPASINMAQRLEQYVPEILRRWEAKARATLPAARRKSRPALLNSIPHFLDELADALSGRGDGASAGPQAPKKHAEQRASLPEYSLEQVVLEYALLRSTIIDVLAASAPVELDDVHVILDTIDLGIAEATSHYVQIQERALRESEERFRLLVEGVKDYAIFMLNPEGHIVSWNRGAERIKGYAADEIIGKHFSIFYTEEDVREGRPQQNLREAINHDSVEDEGLRVRKDGSTFFADVLITSLRDETGGLRGFVKVTRDITERRRMETELRNHVSALAEANHRKDEFLAMLAHELRNPLASVISSAEFLRLHPDNDTDFEQARNIIERQGRHLGRLVDDLLDVARITQGKIALRKSSVELNPLVERVVDTLRPFIEERRQTISVALPDTTVFLEADSTRLSQVLTNLIHNSAKFTEPGGRIDVSVGIERNEAVIQVRDSGSGIEPQLLPHVFDIFTQGSHSHDGSLGIGLTLVKSLVQMHGGTVSARSDGAGKGSEFLVRLPIVEASEAWEADEPTADRALEIPQQSQSPRHVLVVDDNADAAESIAMLLNLYQHKVQVAHSGREALQAAIAERPQVVLLDIGLPDIDGYEVAHRMRAHPALKDVRLVALTGYGQEQDRRRAKQAGFDAHLTKPADLAALQSAINS